MSRDFNISDRPRAQWRDFSDARFIPNAQWEIFSRSARAEKRGSSRKGVVPARASARFVQRNRETRLALRERRVLGRLTRITSSGPRCLLPRQIESGTEKERGRRDIGRYISVNHIDRRRRPATASRARNMESRTRSPLGFLRGVGERVGLFICGTAIRRGDRRGLPDRSDRIAARARRSVTSFLPRRLREQFGSLCAPCTRTYTPRIGYLLVSCYK